jgi:hypothetical protein
MNLPDDDFDFEYWEDCAGRPDPEGNPPDPFPDNWLGQFALQLNVNIEVAEPAPAPRSRPWISRRDRVRILMRDKGRCVICNGDRQLEVGHLISVCAGRRLGLSEAELYSAENLAAMCRDCNGGLGAECVPIQFLTALLKARITGG